MNNGVTSIDSRIAAKQRLIAKYSEEIQRLSDERAARGMGGKTTKKQDQMIAKREGWRRQALNWITWLDAHRETTNDRA